MTVKGKLGRHVGEFVLGLFGGTIKVFVWKNFRILQFHQCTCRDSSWKPPDFMSGTTSELTLCFGRIPSKTYLLVVACETVTEKLKIMSCEMVHIFQ